MPPRNSNRIPNIELRQRAAHKTSRNVPVVKDPRVRAGFEGSLLSVCRRPVDGATNRLNATPPILGASLLRSLRQTCASRHLHEPEDDAYATKSAPRVLAPEMVHPHIKALRMRVDADRERCAYSSLLELRAAQRSAAAARTPPPTRSPLRRDILLHSARFWPC